MNASKITLPETSAATSFYSYQMVSLQGNTVYFSGDVLLCYILNGKGQLQYYDKNVYLHAGDFLFFPRYALFSVTGLEDFQLLEIHLLPGFFQTLCPEDASIAFRNFYITENIHEQRSLELYRSLAELILHGICDESAGALEIMTGLGALFSLLKKHFQQSGSAKEPYETYVQERIRKTLTYIAEHYTRKITIPQISRMLGLNPQYFSVFFSRYFHQSFIDYLNEFRVNSTLKDLCRTRKNITEIAFDSGFQTYKSYSNAFRKIYQVSPSAYRSTYQPAAHKAASVSGISLLQKYLYARISEFPSTQVSVRDIRADLARDPVILTDRRIHAVSIGSGYQLLQEAVYAQLKQAVREYHFTHVHFRDVFCDLLNVYIEPVPDEPMFTWDYIDDIIRKIRSLGLHPFIEIGFMPRELSATKETLGYGYHPCIGIPKSYDRWADLVRSFLVHCREVFGLEEMKTWLFDFWNSANIRSANGYWNASQEEFFHFYRVTWRVFQEISPALQLGTPSFSLPSGMSWYQDFLAMCNRSEIRPSFLAMHLYSCDDNLHDFSGIFPYTTTVNYLPQINADSITHNLKGLRSALEEHGFSDLPILAGEWNISFYLSDLVRDTAFMATYVVKTWIQTLTLLEGLTYCNLSDISEHARPSNLLFPGTQGLLSRDGLKKPAYHALSLLHRLDREILHLEDDCIITRSRNSWHILLYNMSDYEIDTQRSPSFLSDDYRYHIFKGSISYEFRGTFALPAGAYQILTWVLDREHGSAYDAWIRMGSPAALTPQIHQALEHASFPDLHSEQREVTDLLHLQRIIPPHCVILYEIRKAK